MSNRARQAAKRPMYRAPKLVTYGTVQRLTAAGSNPTTENGQNDDTPLP